MISPGSASAKLTDEGGPNVFRVYGRDDRQGAMVGDYLAKHWADKEIAILDDGTTWGAGVSDGVRRRLRERGVRVAVDETFTRGEAEYSELVSKMQAAGVDVFFVGGLHAETGLMFRQAHDRGYDLRLIAASSMATEDFALIAGPELEGTLMIATPDMRQIPGRREVVARFRAQGYEPLETPERLRRAPVSARPSRRPVAGPGSVNGSLPAASSTRCWAGSASTPRATSLASTRGNGTSGRRTTVTCR